MNPGPTNKEVVQPFWNLSCRRSSWTWPSPPLPLSPLYEMGKGPEALGMLCLTQDRGRQPPQAGHAGRPPACGWLCSPSFLWMFWEQLPLCPSDPICSATAQIQFRHLCLHPPVVHCLLGITPIPPNKGPPIGINPLTSDWWVRALSRTVPMPASLKP